MGEAHHGLGTGLSPAHGAFEPAGEAGHHEVLDVLGVLGAEAATDIRRDDMHLAGFQPAERRQGVASLVRELRAGPVGEPLRVRVPRGECCASLDRRRRHPGVLERQLHDHLAVVEGILTVRRPRRDGEHCVGLGFGEQQPVVARGLGGVHQRFERLVVGIHQLGSIGRQGLRFGHHHGERIAHVAHPAGRQRRAQHLLVEHRHARRVRAELEVGCCEDAHHSRHVACLVDVDGAELGVGHGRPHEHRDQRALALDVIDVRAADSQQLRVFLPLHAGAEHAHGRGDLRLRRRLTIKRRNGTELRHRFATAGG